MSNESGFELEPDPPEKSKEAPVERPAPRVAPSPPNMPSVRRMAEEPADDSGLLGRIDPRVRKRLKRVVPVFAISFLLVGWFFAGVGVWAFLLAGALVGAFAAFRRPGEAVLGTASAIAGYGATAAAIRGVPLGIGTIFIVGICGCVGALMAIDDRLAGG